MCLYDFKFLTQFLFRLKIQGMRELDNSNVGPVVFSGDTISITQKAKGNRCNFRLGKSDYRLRDSRFVLGSDNESDMFVGYFSLTPPGTCDFDTDKDDDESLALVRIFLVSFLSLAALSNRGTRESLHSLITKSFRKTFLIHKL